MNITDLSSKYSTEAGEILKSVVKIKEIENNRASSHLIFAVYYLKWLYTVSIGVLNDDWAQFKGGRNMISDFQNKSNVSQN